MNLTFQQDASEEVLIGRLAEAWMRDLGFTTHREVATGSGGPRADLVGTFGPVIWVVECKPSVSLAVLAQADQWLGKAHLVSICTPRGQRRSSDATRRFMSLAGIGWLVTSIDQCRTQAFGGAISEVLHSRWCREIRFPWAKHLNEAQQSWCEAGVQHGHWTPFKATTALIMKTVEKGPGMTLQALVKELKGAHHWKTEASAMQMIPHWIRAGTIPGIEIFKEKGRLRLYLKSQTLI